MPEHTPLHDQAARLREIASAVSQRPPVPVITVTSGKGGVGKSTIALNAAIALTDLGKSVLLVDADENLGNITTMLGIAPATTIADVAENSTDIDDALLSPLPRLKLLAGASGDPRFDFRGADLVNSLRTIEERVDVIIVDTSAGIGRETIGALLASDRSILVTTPEPTAILDAYAMMKRLTAEKADHPVNVLLNNVRVPRDGDEAIDKLGTAVRHFLHREMSSLGSLPADQHVAEAVMRQQPLLRAFPRSGMALSLRVLAETMAGSLVRQSDRHNERRSLAIV